MGKLATQEIIIAKQDRLAQRKAVTPLDAMRALAGMQQRPQPLLSTVTDDGSAMLFGQIRYGMPNYDPVRLALKYADVGLDGITLFTDNSIYDGGIKDLALITRAVKVPVLLQNYIFDEYQVVEARAAGASSLTLIAKLVDAATLRALISATQRNRMSAIVRVQDEAEMRMTLAHCPPVIELGKRDPATDQLDIAALARLRAFIPSTCRVLLYNRLRSLDEARAVAPLKLHAVLVHPDLLAQDGGLAGLREIFSS